MPSSRLGSQTRSRGDAEGAWHHRCWMSPLPLPPEGSCDEGLRETPSTPIPPPPVLPQRLNLTIRISITSITSVHQAWH